MYSNKVFVFNLNLQLECSYQNMFLTRNLCWIILDQVGLFWNIFANIWKFWTILDNVQEKVAGNVGRYWMILDNVGWFWTNMSVKMIIMFLVLFSFKAIMSVCLSVYAIRCSFLGLSLALRSRVHFFQFWYQC